MKKRLVTAKKRREHKAENLNISLGKGMFFFEVEKRIQGGSHKRCQLYNKTRNKSPAKEDWKISKENVVHKLKRETVKRNHRINDM